MAPIAPAAPAVRPAPAPVAAPMPPRAPVAPYHLPTDTLAAIASGAGLQWVNSDADKIRAVQEAMASEPKPIHVPRQPKSRTVADDGPLVLVETKKDLSQIRLPFDSGTPPAAT
jgi:ribonuclease E